MLTASSSLPPSYLAYSAKPNTEFTRIDCAASCREHGMFCKWGLHRWVRREATLRPRTFIYRCRNCDEVRVVHRKPLKTA